MSEKNTSGLRPVGRAVLVRYLEEEQKGLIEIPEMVRERMNMVEQKARVVAIGPLAWQEEGLPRAAVGDVVMITRMAGVQARGPLDGGMYRLINDRDIFALFTGEEE